MSPMEILKFDRYRDLNPRSFALKSFPLYHKATDSGEEQDEVSVTAKCVCVSEREIDR